MPPPLSSRGAPEARARNPRSNATLYHPAVGFHAFGAALRVGLGAARRPGMTGLQPENRLGDDVLLDLVRAAIDRDLAPVEVGRRDRAGPVGPDRRLVRAVLVLLLVGHGVGADDLHQELGRRLLDLRALDLEDR